jgi:UDP-GlcNAc:undecaprenyl-phosphate GlcNAc-1-phosphate transferase
MGDTGSMLLGYTLSVAAVLGLVKTAATVALVVPIIALGLPILDTTFAIIRRKMSGVPIFQPDKGHLHHRLLALGMTQKQAVLIMYFVSMILGIVALFVANVSYKTGIVTVLVVLAVIIYSAKRIGILRKSTTDSTHKQ